MNKVLIFGISENGWFSVFVEDMYTFTCDLGRQFESSSNYTIYIGHSDSAIPQKFFYDCQIDGEKRDHEL